jgi:hypothetical protein
VEGVYVPTLGQDPATVPRVRDPLPTKNEVIERLILGIIKTVAAFSAYALLYVVNVHLKGLHLKILASACIFCLHPIATFDYYLMRGARTIYNGLHHSAQGAKEINQI